MCTTKLSPTALAGSPSASCSMPEASIATWPCGSQRTAKMSADGAAMVRWTSMRSVIGKWCQDRDRRRGRFWNLGCRVSDGLMRNHAETFAAQPQTLRRAIAFIDDNAHLDIRLTDIAAAIGVAPRAVQCKFRRHFVATPLGYLPRV